MDPFSFSPPDRPTTAIDISFGGPLELVAESPLLRVRPKIYKLSVTFCQEGLFDTTKIDIDGIVIP